MSWNDEYGGGNSRFFQKRSTGMGRVFITHLKCLRILNRIKNIEIKAPENYLSIVDFEIQILPVDDWDA